MPVVLVAAAAMHAGGGVGVLSDPGMLYYGGVPALPPERLVGLLEEAGVQARALSCAQVADPKTFSIEDFAVLVLPYGNSFPLPAYDNLRAFHRAGGCLVMTGVPFCHPCTPTGPAGWAGEWGESAQWLDEGRRGRKAARVVHRQRDWQGITSTPRLAVRAGTELTVSAWVRSQNNQKGRDRLFVRFFAGGVFVGQDGPEIPVNAREWTRVAKTVTVPEAATEVDVSLQVWSPKASVDVDEVALVAGQAGDNLLENGGFEVQGGEWKDLGHTDKYFGHDEMGIGTGGFGGPYGTDGNLRVARGNPLGLRPEHLAWKRARLQWLDERSLAPEDEVVPLVVLETPGQQAQVVSAAVKHNCRLFRGARDVWVGQIAGSMLPEDRYCAGQVVARAVAWCLAEKGLLSGSEHRAILKRLDQMRRPEGLPEGIEIIDQPRPWGDTFFPKSRPPAEELLVVDVRRLGPWQRLALTCLQGLVARRRPELWLVFGSWDRTWLEWHKERGYIKGYKEVKDWQGLFRRYRDVFKGAVIPDTGLYQGVLLACNVAACEDLIVAPKGLARELGLEVKVDLRGKFATYAQGMRWLWGKYKNRINHHLCIYAHPHTAFVGTLGYDIQWRGLIFWISGLKDGRRPGADPVEEMQVMAHIFSQMPPNIGMRGFPWAGEGIGLGEGGGVEFCGSYGKGLVCTDHTANICVMSGVRIERLSAPEQPPPPPLQRDKVYIALTMSDGDNLNTLYDYFRPYFEHPAHGRFPIGWGMGPAIIDLMPAVAEWYYLNAKPTDEFLADVSGIAYVYPQTYARRYKERAKVLRGFLEWTARYMRRMDMRTVRPHGGDDERLQRYAEVIPFMHSIFADYGHRGMPYERAVYSLPGGVPVFHGLTTWRYGREGLLREIREKVGSTRPAFVNAFIHNWTFNMDALLAAWEGRDPDMVFVTPAQLASLYRQARERGWVR